MSSLTLRQLWVSKEGFYFTGNRHGIIRYTFHLSSVQWHCCLTSAFSYFQKQGCSSSISPGDPIATLLTGKMLADTQAKESIDEIRGNLFKSPSVPNRLNNNNNNTGSFDIRRRFVTQHHQIVPINFGCWFDQVFTVIKTILNSCFRGFCSKRPEPPRDNNTPVAANKKRRSVLSDGNMPPVPIKTDSSSQPAPTTGESHSHNLARLLRCKSMVEHSAAYELNKSK